MTVTLSDKRVSPSDDVVDCKNTPQLKAIIDMVETVNANLVKMGCDTLVSWRGHPSGAISIDGKVKNGQGDYFSVNEDGGNTVNISTPAMKSPSLIRSLYETARHSASWGNICSKDFNNVGCADALQMVGQFIKNNVDNPYHQKAVNDSVKAAIDSMTTSHALGLKKKMLDPTLRT